MRSTNGYGSLETAMASAHGSAARCLARALIMAFDTCDQTGIPLSQLQRAAIVEAALLEFDGFRVHASSLATVSRLLGEMQSGDPPAA